MSELSISEFWAARWGAASSRQQAKGTSELVSTHCPSSRRCARPSVSKIFSHLRAFPTWTPTASYLLVRRNYPNPSPRGAQRRRPCAPGEGAAPLAVRGPGMPRPQVASRSHQNPLVSLVPGSEPFEQALRTTGPPRPTSRPASVVVSRRSDDIDVVWHCSRRATGMLHGLPPGTVCTGSVGIRWEPAVRMWALSSG